MSTDVEKLKREHLDETDFTSGYETQYEEEYGGNRVKLVVPPPDSENMWYRDIQTVLLLVFLAAVLVCGSIALLMKAFVSSISFALVIFCSYVILALFFIYMEVKSIHLR